VSKQEELTILTFVVTAASQILIRAKYITMLSKISRYDYLKLIIALLDAILHV